MGVIQRTNNYFLYHIIQFLFTFFIATVCDAQELDKWRKPTVTGGFSALTESYSSIGIENRALPFNYTLSANVNVNLLNMSLPFSFVYSKQENILLQPFNQFRIQPSYKWVKVYLGYNSLTLSPLTLCDRTFLGVGVELSPMIKNNYQLHFTTIYGRFNRAVEIDQTSIGIPSFERRGYGVNLGISKNRDNIHLSMFTANDMERSIDVENITGVMPEANLVLGLKTQKTFFKKLTLSANYARSGITKNTLADDANSRGSSMAVLFNTNSTTVFDHSWRTAMNYAFNKFTIGAVYNKTGRDFRSLGTNFMQTDFSDGSVNGGVTIIKGTGNIAGSIGIQKDNLSNALISRNERWIKSVNYNQSIIQKINLSFNFSNYSSTNKVTQNIVSDSINFYHVATNYGFNSSYAYGKEYKQLLMLNASFEKANQYQEYGLAENQTDFINLSIGHIIRLTQSKVSLASTLSYSINGAPENQIAYVGPTFRISKELFDSKLVLNNSLSLLQNDFNGSKSSFLIKNTLGVNYTFKVKHSLGFIFYLLDQKSYTTRPSFLETRASLNYNYNF